MAASAIWEVVGGAEKGGILVREEADLKSAELHSRLAPGVFVQQVALQGERLHFSKLCGDGPDSGWVSLRLKEKPLLEQRGEATSLELETLESVDTRIRWIWCKWHWGRLEEVPLDLEELGEQKEAKCVLLAFQICMSRFPKALKLAEELGDQNVPRLIEQWEKEAEKLSSLFFPSQRDPVKGHRWISDVRQSDVIFQREGVALGLRLLLQCQDGKPIASYPVVLMFHGEDQNIDTFCEEETLEVWRAAQVHLLVADFRGYGFSGGTSSHYHLRPDGEAIVQFLPELFLQQGLGWPWLGGWALYGNGLGSRVACFLAALHGSFFTHGLLLETPWAGSYAPGAPPLPEPPKHTALATMGCNAAGESRFGSRELHLAAAALGQKARQLLPGRPEAAAHFAYVRGNEDLIQAYEGHVLILHGEVDHLVPPEHAVRLHRAARRAKSRHLLLAKGKRADSLPGSPDYATALHGDLHTRAEASLTWRTAAKVMVKNEGSDESCSKRRSTTVRRHSTDERPRAGGVDALPVLLQMGITPLTFDGYAIKSVKLHQAQQHQLARVLLLPQGLHQGSPVGQNEVFCPKCGNDTVVRVPILVDQAMFAERKYVGPPGVPRQGRAKVDLCPPPGWGADGAQLRTQVEAGGGTEPGTKGTVFSMPKPQGGRVWKPIFAEDVGADGWFQPQQQPADRGRARPALGGERRAPQQLSEELFGTGDRSVDWPPSTPLTDSDDEFHIESCSPLAYRARSRFIQRNGRRRLRRTVDVMIEESRIRMLELKVEPRLREQFQPIHLAAHLGDHQALCFLLLDGADVQQKTSKGKSASDLAQAANQQGSHNQVISMLTLRAMPSWEDRLLEQWIVADH
ncbi:Hydrolase_4 domain-containing protein [Durusdinium trenchii]|uniref:Hydrolase_4 domain-containing protein n=1 Tax=Durusdinium trenchii TaxID=1381693 RepID=A0ABP0PXB7_9DINO